MAAKRKRSQKIDPDKNLKSPFNRAFFIIASYENQIQYSISFWFIDWFLQKRERKRQADTNV